MQQRIQSVAIITFALVAANGCGDGASRASAPAMTEASAPAASFDVAQSAVAPTEAAVGGARQAGEVRTSNTNANTSSDTTATSPSMIIRNGSASVQVDSLELAVAAVQRMAIASGGFVGNTSLSAGEYQVRSATLELKIPAARFDAALNGLQPIGTVESVSTTAEDVGEEFVDVSARVANAKRLEERLITLLATRTGKLEDVLAVERELARVREEIERYEGRLRFLKSRVALSTLLVTVHERAPLVSASPGENVIVEAFKDAWRNFVRFVAGGISMLGIIVPVLVLVVAAVALWRKLRGRGTPKP